MNSGFLSRLQLVSNRTIINGFFSGHFAKSGKLKSLKTKSLNRQILVTKIFSNISQIKVYQTMSDTLYNVIFVLGGPGAGKGTQCQKIEQEFGYLHLSAGDLLRAERKKETSDYKDEIEEHIKNGTIVPVEITCALLAQAMKESGKQDFLIDGFPRNKDNLDGWNTAMTNIAKVSKMLFFNCPTDICVQRCLTRGKTSGRVDDNLESLNKRIETYKQSTMPIIQYYQSRELVAEITADKTEDEVFDEVKKHFTS